MLRSPVCYQIAFLYVPQLWRRCWAPAVQQSCSTTKDHCKTVVFQVCIDQVYCWFGSYWCKQRVLTQPSQQRPASPGGSVAMQATASMSSSHLGWQGGRIPARRSCLPPLLTAAAPLRGLRAAAGISSRLRTCSRSRELQAAVALAAAHSVVAQGCRRNCLAALRVTWLLAYPQVWSRCARQLQLTRLLS